MMTLSTTKDTTLPVAVEAFVHCLGSGDWDGMEHHLTPDVLYDASVPEWHYQYAGAHRVVQEYREEWGGTYLWTITQRQAVAEGEHVVLAIEMHGRPIRDGHPVVCRLANVFRLDSGRIAEHRYFCCGEWGPQTVRHIAEHAPMVEEWPR